MKIGIFAFGMRAMCGTFGTIRCLWITALICLAFVLLNGSGCGPSKPEIQFQEWIVSTKKQYRSIDIRNAVLPLFSKYDGRGVPESEIPKEISSLPFFQADPTQISVWWILSGEKALMFVQGGGFGHWGIVVCRAENDQDAVKQLGYRVRPWEHGIYFYRY